MLEIHERKMPRWGQMRQVPSKRVRILQKGNVSTRGKCPLFHDKVKYPPQPKAKAKGDDKGIGKGKEKGKGKGEKGKGEKGKGKGKGEKGKGDKGKG
mgnify:CR=1 FL=1